MNINLNAFEVVVIEQVGDSSISTCFAKYSDYKKDKESYCNENQKVNYSTSGSKIVLHG